MHYLKELIEMVEARETELSQLIRTTQASLGEDAGRLYISPHRDELQFYQAIPHGGKKYLPKDSPEIRRIAQSEYDRSILKAAEHESKLIRRLKLFYEHKSAPEYLYNRLNSVKRGLVRPVTEPDDEFVRKWLEQTFPQSDYPFGPEVFYTDRGERVRSKSEVIIANMLLKYEVPYRYECPLNLEDPEDYSMTAVYPDFTILRVRDRTELYWEHLGLLDNPNYLARNMWKIRTYQMNGYMLGQKLIISSETSDMPLDMRIVEKKILTYCK